jgi:hypothetical protein
MSYSIAFKTEMWFALESYLPVKYEMHIIYEDRGQRRASCAEPGSIIERLIYSKE